MGNTQTNDLTKWSDIKTEFFNGVNQSSVKALLFVVAGAGAGVAAGVVAGAGAAAGVAAGVVTGAAGVLGVGVAGVVAAGVVAGGAGVVIQQRPSIRKLGYAFGLAVPIAVGGVVGITTYNKILNYIEQNNISTAHAPSNCNRDAVKDEIKKLEDAGSKITLDCK